MRCRIKISRCDLFLLRFIFKPLWGWSLLWNVWYKFQLAWGESAERMPSLLLRSTAVVRIISPSTWSVTTSGSQARNVGQAVGSLPNVPGLQFFSTSWTAFYIFFCLLSTITTLFIDAFFFLAKSLCSLLLFSLLHNTEAQKNKLIFSMAIGLSNPESSWILVYILGTLSDPFLLLLHWSLVSAVFQLLRFSDEVPSYLWHISLGPDMVSLGSGPVCS